MGIDAANRVFNSARNRMPNRFPGPVQYINNMLEFYGQGDKAQVCDEQAALMANEFEQAGYDAGIVYAADRNGNQANHAYFYVNIEGERYYGDTWGKPYAGLMEKTPTNVFSTSDWRFDPSIDY